MGTACAGEFGVVHLHGEETMFDLSNDSPVHRVVLKRVGVAAPAAAMPAAVAQRACAHCVTLSDG